MATQTQSFLQGEIVDGKYRLHRYLGGSDHSAVFLTEFGDLHPRDAAIKLLPAPPGNAESRLSRWRLAANLSHPNLVQILEMGRCQVGNTAMLYVVTELASENLGEILPQRALAPEEARDVLASVLDVLVFLHSRGFVHRHIKPSNIMAVGEQLKLSSDGICRLGETVENGGLGAYEPPEGARAGVTTAGDIWSLGMTLVEVLTQELPEWSASDRKDPVPPETMPPPFPEIVRHCLRRDPKNRWPATTLQAHVPRTISAPVRIPARAPAPAQAPIVEHADEEANRAHRYIVQGAVAAVVLATILAGAKLIGHKASPAATTARETTVSSATQPQAKSAQVQPTFAAPARTTGTSREAVPPPPRHATPTREAVAAAPKRVAPPVEAAAKRAAPNVVAMPRAVSPTSSASNDAPASRASADLTPGRVLQRVMPDVPRKASDTIWGTVRVGVKVNVDPAGNVTAAELESAGPSRYFARLSVEAAQKWRFAAPERGGQAIASAWVLHFGYRRDGVNVEPSQTRP